MDCKKRYSGVRDQRLSSLAILNTHTHKHKAVDIDGIVTEFALWRVDVSPFSGNLFDGVTVLPFSP